ncbi:DUF1285 domain-containing protein [Rheinheimera marina]|uniref:DUF1285 domain-containing protein n=1 Tax=Rheinheimera marina TaxID=1774958 RepID=A0ABV9JIM6_9GAMM
MNLNALQQQLQQPNLAPLELWDPPFCGDLPLVIKADGRWCYQGSPIERLALVQLFASVLVCRAGEYFLLTPVEKVRIQVEDAAFLITELQQRETGQGVVLLATTNLQHQVLISAEYPLVLQPQADGQLLPYLQLWRGLTAKFSRPCYYQLAEWACRNQDQWFVESAGQQFLLGA